jgi:lipopolysaccharide/colanic/teichoic acid biosynthesis glycosyltransferase
MRLIVVREARDSGPGGETGLLQYALSTAPLNDAVLDGLHHLWCCGGSDEPVERIGWTNPDDLLWFLPRDWQAGLVAAPGPAVFYGDSLSVDARALEDRRKHSWAIIMNGRFAAYANHSLLERLLGAARADCLAVTAASDLLACRERLRLTPDNQIVGYRRWYAESMAPTPVPVDWPHYLFVRREALGTALQSGLLSNFGAWADRCRAAGLRVQGVAVAGSAYDLESQEGILAVSQVALSHPPGPGTARRRAGERRKPLPAEDRGISPHSRLIGPVLLGKQVTIEAGAVVVGPTVLCDGCTVGRDAIIDSAIVGAGISVESSQSLAGCIVTASKRWSAAERTAAPAGRSQEHVCPLDKGVFRTWPRFSYAQCFKRIADVVAAIVVLILFAPVIPVLALAVKISSPGPVFFRDKRQGLQGKPFRCMKFRTMRQGADQIQDKLRFVSEVDGPQFKMADDPRITTVGRFLRETYLDEIPQFFNVLGGQMSVVGPRPSPESENTLCPSWRDARLSVRPGITGLWQVRRTREPQKDFQEWIHYDTQYVRDFSFGLDLWICWRTFRKMIETFVRQF